MNELTNFGATDLCPYPVLILAIGNQELEIPDYIRKSEIFGLDFLDLSLFNQPLNSSAQTKPGLSPQKHIEPVSGVSQIWKPECMAEIAHVVSKYKILFFAGNLEDNTDLKPIQLAGTIAKEVGIPTIGVVVFSLPAKNNQKLNSISTRIDEIKKQVDSLLLLPVESESEFKEGETANHLIGLAVRTIYDMANTRGYICVAFAEICEAIQNSGYGCFTSGKASGPSKTKFALEEALLSPLVRGTRMSEAKCLLVSLTIGSEDVYLQEIVDLIHSLENQVNPECNIIWNVGYRPNLGNNFRVSIIGTGIPKPAFLG